MISIQEVGSEEWDQKEDMNSNEEDFAEFTSNGLDPGTFACILLM